MSAPVARAGAIAPGHMLRVVAGGDPILLCNVEGTIYAIEDYCSHDGEPLGEAGELEGCRIRCPRHGATFDVTTGKALTLPAVSPIATYRVRVAGDDVFVDA
jgi:3-phenylpropionate/trans-cinnamate dioxygenase ferredoxin subunit